MAWRVGMKVVCVEPYEGYLVRDEIYTISRIGSLSQGGAGVNVAEVDTSSCRHEVAFAASRFRPLTDISDLTAILNGKRIHLPDLVETEARSSLADRFVGTVGVLAGGWMICTGAILAEFWWLA